ncbi:MAG: alpha/beta hydrolase [Bacteroidaceae bacterium]|nr:alpha/beta hydrolase [Bacteroidaceae bacterium]
MKGKGIIMTLLAFMAIMPCCAGNTVRRKSLDKEQAAAARADVIDHWYREIRSATDYIAMDRKIIHGDLEMPISCMVFGQKPDDGYSLYISLHGGGNAPKDLNDSQWQNQWHLYRPAEGVYICPRAPYDDWDMHFKPGLDEFYKDIILFAYSHLGVNPDKVYIMGYSAGGDGVWRLAPRMADTWAAASMMAGHPGDVSLVNLRNTPFMVWCGALDSAYDRNRQCSARIAELDSLQNSDPEGYIHEGHIVAGKSHWMDQADTLAVGWMAQYRRNPYPSKIVWRQEEVLHDNFYWVSVPDDEMARGKEVRLSVRDNVISIDRCDYSRLTFGLNDSIVNLDKPVKVKMNDRTIARKKLVRSMETMEKTLHERQDARYAFDSELEVIIKR